MKWQGVKERQEIPGAYFQVVTNLHRIRIDMLEGPLRYEAFGFYDGSEARFLKDREAINADKSRCGNDLQI